MRRTEWISSYRDTQTENGGGEVERVNNLVALHVVDFGVSIETTSQ